MQKFVTNEVRPSNRVSNNPESAYFPMCSTSSNGTLKWINGTPFTFCSLCGYLSPHENPHTKGAHDSTNFRERHRKNLPLLHPGHPNAKAIKRWSLETGVKVATNKTKRKASLKNKEKGKGNRYAKAARKDDPMHLV